LSAPDRELTAAQARDALADAFARRLRQIETEQADPRAAAARPPAAIKE